MMSVSPAELANNALTNKLKSNDKSIFRTIGKCSNKLFGIINFIDNFFKYVFCF